MVGECPRRAKGGAGGRLGEGVALELFLGGSVALADPVDELHDIVLVEHNRVAAESGADT